MDCKTARLLIELGPPRTAELAADDAAALEQHIHLCPECDLFARSERQADAQIGRAMRDVSLPAGQPARLLAHLGKEHASRRHRWLRRTAAAAAVAAALLVGIGFWLSWTVGAPGYLDVAGLRDDVASTGHSREWIEEWFRERYGLTVSIPERIGNQPINYGLLAHYDLADCQGKRVPMLLFVKGQERGRIYIVSGRQFEFRWLPDDLVPFEPSVGYTAQVWRDPETSFAYVLVYSGNPAKPFFLGTAS